MNAKFEVVSDELLDEVVGGAANTELGKLYEKKYGMGIKNTDGHDLVRIKTKTGKILVTEISNLSKHADRIDSYEVGRYESDQFKKFPANEFLNNNS